MENDPEIADDVVLFRRISPLWIKADDSVSSAAFQNQSGHDAFSVIIASLLILKPGDSALSMVLDGFSGYSLVSFTVGNARSLNQGVTHVPIDVEPAHGQVNGAKSKSIRRKFSGFAKRLDT